VAYSNELILFGSLVLLASIVASAASSRLGAPLLLVFLLIGMLLGEDGPGRVQFDDVHTAQLVGSIALAIIIFDGGLRTSKDTLRIALRPAISLATVGVVLTSVIVAAAATWLFDFGWLPALLIGAIIGSTDAAAVFGILHSSGVQLKQRVAATLEIESASNDPMAIFLTMALIGIIAAGHSAITLRVAADLVVQFGIGALAGWVGGRLLGALINRLRLISAFYPLLAAVGGVFVFAVAAMLGGSGFLAIYVCGIVLANRPLRSSKNILRVHDGFTWLAQITMFLMLGLLVTPHRLAAVAPQGLVVALVLMLVARPLAVFISLLPFRFPWREQLFVSWVGLRGAVPMILAIFPMTAGLADAGAFFNVAFFVVLASLLVQGWTIAPAARLLGLVIPPGGEPLRRVDLELPGDIDREVVGYRVQPGSVACELEIASLPLYADGHVTAVLRDGELLRLDQPLALQPDDLVYVFTNPAYIADLNRLFDPHAVPSRADNRVFYGAFTLNGASPLAQVTAAYGLPLDARYGDHTLDRYFHAVFHGRPVVGDRVRLGGAELVVKAMRDGRVTEVGLRVLT
jgi:cell volume regulation protein A